MDDLTDVQRARLDAVQHDEAYLVREGFRVALWAFVVWPWARRRRERVITAFDRMLDVFVNRVMGSAGAVVTPVLAKLDAIEARLTMIATASLVDEIPPDERRALRALIPATAARVDDLDRRVSALEARDAG